MKLKRVILVNMNTAANITPEHLAALTQLSPDTEFITVPHADVIPELFDDADALFLWQRFGVDFENWCMEAKNLKWIHMFTSGTDKIMATPMGKSPDIRITATKGIHGPPMSDHVLSFIFSFLRRFNEAHAAQLNHCWIADELVARCDESFGKTVGIIGLGSIGLEVARKCQLLGMRTIGLRRSPSSCPWLDICLSSDQLDALLEESDFVVLCLPLTAETRNLISAPQLSKMKKSAYLINVARGAIVDEHALHNALADGTIAGAGLDVFTEEPLPADSPFWAMPNVIITHHTAPHSPLYMHRAMEIVKENVARYLADEPLLHEVIK